MSGQCCVHHDSKCENTSRRNYVIGEVLSVSDRQHAGRGTGKWLAWYNITVDKGMCRRGGLPRPRQHLSLVPREYTFISAERH